MRKADLTALIITALVVLCTFTPAIAQGESGTTLSATVSATPHWTRTYSWTIDKSVTPDTWALFTGDSGTSRYTITVTKDAGTDAAWVDGQVCVTNGGAVDTENLTITAKLYNGLPPPNDFVKSVSVDVSGNPVLSPGETGCYSYHIDLTSSEIHAGGTYKVTAEVTITNHSGFLGTPYGPSPSATLTFPSTPTLVNDTIHVEDTNGGSWTFSSSGSESYDETYTCDSDKGTKSNTATIKETGQSDSASVTVNCYALDVKKDATTAFKRTYTWQIKKTGDQSSLTLSTGQQFKVNYTADLSATSADSDWGVSGNISVKNPAPIAAVINSVSDVVSGAGAATVDFGSVTFPYTLAAGATLTGTYSKTLPNADTRTNTATATLQNYSYDYQFKATPSGTTNFTGTASVDFSSVSPTKVDECIDVTDDKYGDLGTVCFADQPKTFSYSLTVGPYADCGTYQYKNTASFTTKDTGTTGSSSWTVDVNVPCEGGCTLTPGYWKTHSNYGPAPYDDTWALVMPSGEDSPFFGTGQTWYEVLWTQPQNGNAYYILAHAYIAAYLNGLNGADTTAVDPQLAHAAQLLDQYDGDPKSMSQIKGAVRADFIATASILDQYNNGYIGPGHCSE